jgi:hypothetical protein
LSEPIIATFFGLSRRRHAQVRAALGRCAGQIRMCQGLALVAITENDVAGLGLRLAQLKASLTRTISPALWRPFRCAEVAAS